MNINFPYFSYLPVKSMITVEIIKTVSIQSNIAVSIAAAEDTAEYTDFILRLVLCIRVHCNHYGGYYHPK